jgi:hypothetical protein
MREFSAGDLGLREMLTPCPFVSGKGSGENMYADVEEVNPGAALKLQAKMRASAAAAAQTASAASPSASAGSSSATSNASDGASFSNTVRKAAGAPHSSNNMTSTASTNDPAASPTPTPANKRFLLLCVVADPLPRFRQVELIENCNDNILFQEMRRAYESLCSRRVDHLADGTSRWVRDAIEEIYLLRDRIEKGLVTLLEIVHIRWFVQLRGVSEFYMPNNGEFRQGKHCSPPCLVGIVLSGHIVERLLRSPLLLIAFIG